jgi:hypothetical protein
MLPLLLAAVTTTTNPDDVPRVVGEPLPWGIWFASGLLLLAAILLAGWLVSRRMHAAQR